MWSTIYGQDTKHDEHKDGWLACNYLMELFLYYIYSSPKFIISGRFGIKLSGMFMQMANNSVLLNPLNSPFPLQSSYQVGVLNKLLVIHLSM